MIETQRTDKYLKLSKKISYDTNCIYIFIKRGNIDIAIHVFPHRSICCW